jgi:hypothetical protein
MDVVFSIFALLIAGMFVLRVVFALTGATTSALDKVADRPGVQAPPFSPHPRERERDREGEATAAALWWLPPATDFDHTIGGFFLGDVDGDGVDGDAGDGGGWFDGGGGFGGGGF